MFCFLVFFFFGNNENHVFFDRAVNSRRPVPGDRRRGDNFWDRIGTKALGSLHIMCYGSRHHPANYTVTSLYLSVSCQSRNILMHGKERNYIIIDYLKQIRK